MRSELRALAGTTPENNLCKQRTKPVLSSASISCQARANHEQGRAGARWTVEGDSGHVVLYGGVGGWWHGGTGGNWAPHGDIMVFVGELVVELEGCVDGATVSI